MQHLTCDVTGVDLAEPEATVLVIRGPLRRMIGRSRVELSKPAAAALARWLGYPINRADAPAAIPGPEAPRPPTDADPTGGHRP